MVYWIQLQKKVIKNILIKNILIKYNMKKILFPRQIDKLCIMLWCLWPLWSGLKCGMVSLLSKFWWRICGTHTFVSLSTTRMNSFGHALLEPLYTVAPLSWNEESKSLRISTFQQWQVINPMLQFARQDIGEYSHASFIPVYGVLSQWYHSSFLLQAQLGETYQQTLAWSHLWNAWSMIILHLHECPDHK